MSKIPKMSEISKKSKMYNGLFRPSIDINKLIKNPKNIDIQLIEYINMNVS